MGLNDFGDGHPISYFVGKPRMILGVPHIVCGNIPSNNLQSFIIGNQYIRAGFGHLVLGAYPGHRVRVYGVRV
jgi:hypothetical protein